MAYIVKTRKCLKYRLYKEMKRGRLLNLSNVPRQIGKTTLLAKIAKARGAILVEPNLNLVNYFKKEFIGLRILTPNDILQNKIHSRIGDPELVVLDEGIKPELIKRFKKEHKIVAGYIGECDSYKIFMQDGLYYEEESRCYTEKNGQAIMKIPLELQL
jgi:predicted AAA+ superfamily ATPase